MLSADRQACGRVKRQDCSWIGGKSGEAVGPAGTEAVHDLIGREGCSDEIRRVARGVQQEAFRNTVVGNPEAPSEHEFVVELVTDEGARTPGKPNLWAEVIAVGIREILADLDHGSR